MSEYDCYRDGGVSILHEFSDAASPASGFRTVDDVPKKLDTHSVAAYDCGENSIQPSESWTVTPPFEMSRCPGITGRIFTLANRERIATGKLLALDELRGVVVERDGRIVEIKSPTVVDTMIDMPTGGLSGLYKITFASMKKTAKLTYACTGVDWYEHVYLYHAESDQDAPSFKSQALLYIAVANHLGRDIRDATIMRFHGGNQGPRIVPVAREGGGERRAMSYPMAAMSMARSQESVSDQEATLVEEGGEQGVVAEIKGETIAENDTKTVYYAAEKNAGECKITYFVHVGGEYDTRPSCSYEFSISECPWSLAKSSKVTIYATAADGHNKLMANAEPPGRVTPKRKPMTIVLGKANDIEVTDVSVDQVRDTASMGGGGLLSSHMTFLMRSRKAKPRIAEIRASAVVDKKLSILVDGTLQKQLMHRETHYYVTCTVPARDSVSGLKIEVKYD
jgi:hypothetical protein